MRRIPCEVREGSISQSFDFFVYCVKLSHIRLQTFTLAGKLFCKHSIRAQGVKSKRDEYIRSREVRGGCVVI